jgi:hypothetical protein
MASCSLAAAGRLMARSLSSCQRNCHVRDVMIVGVKLRVRCYEVAIPGLAERGSLILRPRLRPVRPLILFRDQRKRHRPRPACVVSLTAHSGDSWKAPGPAESCQQMEKTSHLIMYVVTRFRILSTSPALSVFPGIKDGAREWSRACPASLKR